MPVATLRIWEQRYQAVRPNTTASGHRLYTAEDIDRVSLLRRLTEQGYAIGLLAALNTEQLREMMHAPKASRSANKSDAPQQVAMKTVVVGKALARRLQRLSDRQLNGLALQKAAVFDTLTEATQASQVSVKPAVDLLLWQADSLQPGAQRELRLAQEACGAYSAAVIYSYSSAAGRAELTRAGTQILQEPGDDDSLCQWLASLQRTQSPAYKAARTTELAYSGATGPTDQIVLPPRFDSAALAEFAALSSEIACECPSHLAQIVLKISNFETYSGDCANRSTADAQMHTYLQRVAGAARMLFEAALEHVAITEGLLLPHTPEGFQSKP